MYYILSSFGVPEQRGFIYAIVYEKVCTGESAATFVHQAVAKAGYAQKMKEWQHDLQSKYPNAKRIKVGSSFHEYGKSAKYIYAIKYTATPGSCPKDVITVKFGQTQDEASSSVYKVKNAVAPKASETILASEFIPTVLSAN